MITGSRWYWWEGRIEVLATQRCVQRADNRGCDTVWDTTYRANETIEVRIRDLGSIGTVIDSVLAHRVTNISGIEFSATDASAARAEALREATMLARQQAEAIAVASGAQLGRVVLLSTDGAYERGYGGIQLRGIEVSGVADGASGTVITRPSIPVSVTVHGRWQLVERR